VVVDKETLLTIMYSKVVLVVHKEILVDLEIVVTLIPFVVLVVAVVVLDPLAGAFPIQVLPQLVVLEETGYLVV
tara:strand:- start:425 stop:646 length:222 start_codon:yes stop_codon:yes gene_type:complete